MENASDGDVVDVVGHLPFPENASDGEAVDRPCPSQVSVNSGGDDDDDGHRRTQGHVDADQHTQEKMNHCGVNCADSAERDQSLRTAGHMHPVGHADIVSDLLGGSHPAIANGGEIGNGGKMESPSAIQELR